MDVLLVLSFKVKNAEEVPEIIKDIHPPGIPGFAGECRIVVGDDVKDTLKFLDEGD